MEIRHKSSENNSGEKYIYELSYNLCERDNNSREIYFRYHLAVHYQRNTGLTDGIGEKLPDNYSGIDEKGVGNTGFFDTRKSAENENKNNHS